MTEASASLARSITWRGSKQTYYTALLMVDRALIRDCYRAYGYFRWADDQVDDSSMSDDERLAFIQRQRVLIEGLYRGQRPAALTKEEEIVADLIQHDSSEGSGLNSFILNFLAIIEFDAQRRGRLITQEELTWYAETLGKSVTNCIQHFIANSHPYPEHDNRYLAATAAHITHMLRDMESDIPEGYINIPLEVLEAHGIGAIDLDHPRIVGWVRDRVRQARAYFHKGKRYLDGLDVLRCKLVGYWYCARFEAVLSAIEENGYTLNREFNERRKLSNVVRLLWITLGVTFQHSLHLVRKFLRSH